MIVMGSEVGVQIFAAEDIKEKGRLRPGKILLVDTKLGIIIPDKEVKAQLSSRNPYGNWLKENRLQMEDIEVKQRVSSSMGDQFSAFSKVFGYSKEDMEMILKPMAVTGDEPTSSMGNDTPLACFFGAATAFLQLFPPGFCTGNQSTNRLNPRRAGDVADQLHRFIAHQYSR